MPEAVRNHIDVLGGHKLARLYLRKLSDAKQDGRLQYDLLGFCDPELQTGEVDSRFTQTSYSDFISQRLTCQDRNARDSLIPDHTAPHVFFQVCLDFIAKHAPDAVITLAESRPPLGLPFEMPTTHGVTPLSYATWVCPLECEEPATCPAIAGERKWDFDRFFAELEKKEAALKPDYLFLGFSCDQLIDGIAHIPWDRVTSNFARLQERLRTSKTITLSVATYSRCHAILGEATVIV